MQQRWRPFLGLIDDNAIYLAWLFRTTCCCKLYFLLVASRKNILGTQKLIYTCDIKIVKSIVKRVAMQVVLELQCHLGNTNTQECGNLSLNLRWP